MQKADLIFGVGGGRAIDTGKVVADKAEKAYFAFPTVASNCAPSTAIAVIYKEDRSLVGYYYLPQPPIHTFINMNIIVDSPFHLFWAGIGDAMSKECESELASREAELFHTVLVGRVLGQVCTAPLLDFGEKALTDFKKKAISHELQEVVLDIIISTGLVSNCTTGDQAIYYYNSSVAHLFYNLSTILPQVVENHLHGEIVSFGVLVLLTYDKQFALRDRIATFYKKTGYPTTLAYLDIQTSELDMIVDKAPSITEWNCVPQPLTKEAFKQAIIDTDAYGKTL